MPLRITQDAPLERLNTFGVAARARALVELSDPADLPAAIEALSGHRETMVLGGGSNVLFTRDFEGAVLLVRLAGRRALDGGGSSESVVEAAAGENWDAFVRWTLARRLCGLENLSLIPGSVGASPIQNIGAYGVEMRERFESLDAVHLRTGESRVFAAGDCRFAYRDSVFKQPSMRDWLITAVRFRLPTQPRLKLDYGEIREELARGGVADPTPEDVARAVCAIRRRKLPDPAVLGNAGSFFRNPIVDAQTARALAAANPGMPVYPAGAEAGASAGQGDGAPVKLSAGWLIDRCGWKGRREGDAGVHEKHALVLVNHGRATGAQVLALARRIQASVLERFGVRLEPEPTIV